MQTWLEYSDGEHTFWECYEAYCLQCGSTRDTVAKDGEVLEIKDPICCDGTI